MHLLMFAVSARFGLFLSVSFSPESALLKTPQAGLHTLYNHYGMDIHGTDGELPEYLIQTVRSLHTPIQSISVTIPIKFWI